MLRPTAVLSTARRASDRPFPGISTPRDPPHARQPEKVYCLRKSDRVHS